MDLSAAALSVTLRRAETDGHAIEGIILDGQALRISDHAFDVTHMARIQQPIAPISSIAGFTSESTTRPVLPT